MIKYNEVTWYSKLAAIIFFIGFLPALTFYIGTQYQSVMNFNSVQVEKSETTVKVAVFNYVDEIMGEKWDKKVMIERVNHEGEAYTGKWYSRDAWPWIAFNDNGEWRVLISRDGFDCSSLKAVPIKYQEFFKDLTTNASGNLVCYDWLSKD